MKYLSLFSGIGGFELGIQNAKPKWQCVGFSEINKYAIQIYQKHFPKHKNYGDITAINTSKLPNFDFIFGGFPCQAFSTAGKRRGFEDTRGTLFFEIARILRDKKPSYFLLENVKGLLSHEQGNTFETIITTLDELGYDIQWQVLNSCTFGVPQKRERVYIVGYFRGASRPEIFPLRKNGSWDNEKQFQREETSKSFGTSFNVENWRGRSLPKLRRLTPIECERLQGFPDNWTQGISDTQRYKCLGNAVTTNVIEYLIKQFN